MIRILAIFILSAGSLWASSELERLNQAFETKLAEETQTFKATLQMAGIKYMTQLDAMENNLRAAGDLDGIIAVQAEKKRLGAMPSVSRDDLVNKPESLRTFQIKFMEFGEGQARGYTQKLVQLVEAYKAKLGELETWMTQNNRVGDAIVARNLRRSIVDGPKMLEHELFADLPERGKIAVALKGAYYGVTMTRFKDKISATASGTLDRKKDPRPAIKLSGGNFTPDGISSEGNVSIRTFTPDGHPKDGTCLALGRDRESYQEKVADWLNEVDDGDVVVLVTCGRVHVNNDIRIALKNCGAIKGPQGSERSLPYVFFGVKGLPEGAGIEVQGKTPGGTVSYPNVPAPAPTAKVDQPENSAAAKGGLFKRPQRKSGFRRF